MATEKPSVIKKGMRNLSDSSNEVDYNSKAQWPRGNELLAPLAIMVSLLITVIES
jgi:hypothetical protein